MIGRTIGTYRLIKRVGIGGVGEVFVGEDLMLERQVAIKVMKPDLTSRPDIVERFRAEAVTLAKVNHVHIATVYAFLPQDADFFLVMEYVRGWTLQHLLAVQGALAPTVAVRLIRQALDGIGCAHRHRVIHRDIKPSNIMLSNDGMIKVMDFGLARVLGSAHATRVDRFVGTLEYISPEQLRGQEADIRSDVYALGTVLYELVTGYLPFEHYSEYSLVRAKVEEPPPPPRTFVPSLSEDLEGFILKALSTAPEDRFQSAEAFSLALDQCRLEVDEASSLSALLCAQRQYAPIDDVLQNERHGHQIRASSGLEGVDDQATRLAEVSFFSDMKPFPATFGRKPHKYRRSVLMSALLVSATSLLYFFAPLDFIQHATLNPIRLESPADISVATAPLSPGELQSDVPVEMAPELSRTLVLHTDDTSLSTADISLDIALGYDTSGARSRSFGVDAWELKQLNLVCQMPDDEPLLLPQAKATSTTLALTFEMGHAFAAIPGLGEDDVAQRVLMPIDDAIPMSDNPAYPAKSQKSRKRKIDRKPAQRGSGWVIRR